MLLPTVAGDDRVELRISRDLYERKDRIEPLIGEVREKDSMPVLLQGVKYCVRDGMVEAPRCGLAMMTEIFIIYEFPDWCLE